jgi:hypothetical protein
MTRNRSAAAAALLCALIASLLLTAAPAGAEPADSAPIRNLSEGGLSFPMITGPEAPEEYPFQVEPLPAGIVMRQISDQQVIAEYVAGRHEAWSITAGPASDVEGSTVPTTIVLSEDEEGPVVTLIVHYRAGNPVAGGAPFLFPIVNGAGWAGGFHTNTILMPPPEARPTPAETSPPLAEPAPPLCIVPPLRGLRLSAAKAKLRAADCGIGQVHLAREATKARSRVVKQFKPEETQLPAGSPVAIKLGGRS